MNQLAPSSFNHPGAGNNHNNPFAYTPPPQQTQQQQGNFYPQSAAGQSLGYGAGSSSSSTPVGGMLQGQQQQLPSYTSAPAYSIPPQQAPIRPSASPPTQQQPHQQQPHNRFSPPNAAPQSQNPTPPATTTKHYPMAAPPLPNTPSTSSNAMTTASSPPKTPLSPTSESREAQRIAHLLTLNSALLSEIASLQSAGHGGVLNPAQAEAARQKGLPDKMASEDYIHTMRRVQANLQYLMHKQQPGGDGSGGGGGGGKQLPGPAIMTAPPHLAGEKLKGEYERLRELFPEWMGIEGRAGGGLGTPGRQNSGQIAQGQMGQQQ